MVINSKIAQRFFCNFIVILGTDLQSKTRILPCASKSISAFNKVNLTRYIFHRIRL